MNFTIIFLIGGSATRWCQHKYLANLPGHTMALALKYRLLCGSVVVSSPLMYHEWYYSSWLVVLGFTWFYMVLLAVQHIFFIFHVAGMIPKYPIFCRLSFSTRSAEGPRAFRFGGFHLVLCSRCLGSTSGQPRVGGRHRSKSAGVGRKSLDGGPGGLD